MTNEAYITEALDRMKRKGNDDELCLVPILNQEMQTVGFLRPITVDFKETIPRCAELLSKWRRDNPTLSPTRFSITEERTEKWLLDYVINNNRRILFMIQDLEGVCIGHMGFAGFEYDRQAAEVDLVVRGEKDVSKGIMRYAMGALIQWGKQELKLKHIGLEVLWDNEHAISFYQSCGFQKRGLIPLEMKEIQGEVRWLPISDDTVSAEKYYLQMELCQ